MNKRKILSLLLVLLLVVCSIAIVSCNDKTEWPEAGSYKFTAGKTECTLVLNVGDTFTIVYKDSSESGVYTLTDSTLVLDFNAKDKENITAEYAGNTITLEYDGANMLLYKNVEYTVSFDVKGGSAVASQTVTNGSTATQPENPTREDYDFLGWYKDSAYTEMFNFDTPVTGDMTLYARWNAAEGDNQLGNAQITVSASRVEWTSVFGARAYLVEIISSEGETVLTQQTSANVLNVDFDEFEPSVYTVKVTAIALTGEEDNSVQSVTYGHKTLEKAAGFQVIDPTLLVFNQVKNAQKYFITVECGDPNHNHTSFDNGSNNFFSLDSCVMTADGIKVTVTAVAEGFASSTSDVFVYKKVLGAIEGLKIDAATETVSWNPVDKATSYMVSVTCGDESHNHGFVNVGSQNFISLKNCAPKDGGIVVKVYPATNGYLSPEAATLTYNKAALQTPASLGVTGSVLGWNAVAGAASYEVKINGTTYEVDSNSYDMAALLDYVEGTEYSITVRAMSEGGAASLWSDEVVARYYQMSSEVSYAKGVLSWAPVVGAMNYEIQVNDGEIITVSGVSSSPVVLTKEGVNTLKVRFADGKLRSDWETVEVYAHAITFNTLGGSEIIVQYKAVGDPMTLPAPTKTGYDFYAWYNVPGGAASNGKIYADTVFAGSGSMALYAQYTAKQFDVDFDFGLDGTGSATSGKVSYENDYTLPVPTANDPTTVFGGWYSLPYGMGTQYTDENGESVAPWTQLSGGRMYAFWVDSAIKYTLTTVNGKEAYMISAGDRISLVKEITIPATYKGVNVAMVAGNAFLNCTQLEVINLPETIEQISSVSPFEGTSSLRAINVYEVDGVSGRFWSEDGVLFDNGSSAVANPKLLHLPAAKTGSYAIPEGVNEIPEGALRGSLITKIVIPASVTRIGREAFANCVNLTSVTFAAPAKSEDAKSLLIAARAFAGCTNLEKIVLPARLEEIKLQKYVISGDDVAVDNVDNAFFGCTSLLSITVASGNASYKSVDGMLYSEDGTKLIYCPATKQFKDGKVVIPAGTQQIAPGAFVDCKGMTEVIIPNSVVLVGECAFYNMTELTKVTFGGDAIVNLTIGKFAFRGCTSLGEISFEKDSRVSTIGDGAFQGCSFLGKITIPATVASIGASAFRDCAELEAITFEASGRNLVFGEDVFYNCTSLTSVHLPANVSEVPGIFSGCSSLTEVTVDENSEYFTAVEGVLFDKNLTTIIFFPGGKSGDYVLPETVTTIGNGVFRDVKSLDSITIGNAITHIGDDAFRGAKIDEYIFEAGENTSPLTIGAYAFYGASLDSTITLPAHTKSVGEYAFAYLNQGAWDGSGEIVLNQGLETLSAYTFYNSMLSWGADVVVPASVKTIGEFCFSGESGWDGEYVPAVLTFENSQLEAIGDFAFAFNSEISDITIPASVKTIGNFAFYECELEEVVFAPDGVLETIGAYAFSGGSSYYTPNFTTITIPKSVTSIGAYAFAYCGDLEELYFEKGGTEDLVIGTSYVGPNEYGSVISVTGHSFYNVGYITKIELPARLVELKEGAFKQAGYYLYGDDSIELSFHTDDGDIRLTTIGNSAFHYAKLTSFHIPASVRNLDPAVDEVTGVTYDRLGIGENAFYGMYDSLSSLTFELGGTDTLTIGKNAIANCDLLTSIELPARLGSYISHTGEVIDGLQGGYQVFDESIGLTSITVEDGGEAYCDVDGVLFNGDKTELILYPASKEGSFTVPAEVVKISDKAFYYASGLTSIGFAEGSALKKIGASAFAYSGLTEITLPTNVETIGSGTFNSCQDLTRITLSKNLTAFDGSMIEYCYAISGIFVEQGSAVFYSDNGVLYNAAKTELIIYPSDLAGESYTVLPTTKVIAASAFNGNANLTSVVLPEGLQEIGEFAFSQSALTSVVIPSTVELLDGWAFSNCYDLESITFADGGSEKLVVNKYAFQQISAESIKLPARLAYLGNYAFYNARSLSEIEFAENSQLVELGDQVFQNNALVNVTLPDGIAKIGSGLFTGCSSLKSVVFGEGLLSLGDETFTGTYVESVHFPASLKSLGIETFAGISSLERVTFAPNAQLEVIPAGTFYGTGIRRITLPAGLKEIGDKDTTSSYSYGAFQNCTSLETVTFEDGAQIVKFGINAFKGCTALESVEIPATVSTLGESAFEDCSALVSVTIPTATTQLGMYLFDGCTSLTDVVMNARPAELPGYMFQNCPITSFQIPDSVYKIGANCFIGTSLTEIVVPASVTVFEGYGTFSECAELERVTILGDAKVICESMFEDCVMLSEVNLPSSVEEIQEDAFRNCALLTSFEIPASLKTFANAFSGTSISAYTVEEGSTTFSAVAGVLFSADKTQIISYPAFKSDESFQVPKEVTYIGEGTFSGVSTLRYVTFEEGGTAELTIGDAAFAEMTSLVKISLPERLKSIGDEAFYDCANLSVVVIPSTMTVDMIGEDAFYDCSSLVELVNKSEIDFENEYSSDVGYINYACESIIEDIADSAVAVDADGYITFTLEDTVYLIGYVGGSKNLVVPTDVTAIYPEAFSETDIESVELPEGLTEIGEQAFYYCESLESINIPSTVASIGEEAFYYCRPLTSIVIPESVTTMGSSVFSGCYDLTVFARAAAKPDGWSSYWMGGADVLWGYTGENIIYTFVTPEGAPAVDSQSSNLRITIPEGPEFEGMVFMGWYDNEAFEGAAITGEYYNSVKTTLYARYITEAQYAEEMLKGKSFDYAIDAVSGGTYQADITSDNDKIYVKITVAEGETWNIKTAHVSGYSSDHVIYIYDAERSALVSRKDGGGYEEDYDYTFSAAGTYYVAIGYWSSYNTGTVAVTVTNLG